MANEEMTKLKDSELSRARRQALGKSLRHYRVLRELTLQELATRVGKSAATLSRIEAGQQPVDLDTFLSITRELGVDAYRILFELQVAENPQGPRREMLGVMDRLLRVLEESRPKAT